MFSLKCFKIRRTQMLNFLFLNHILHFISPISKQPKFVHFIRFNQNGHCFNEQNRNIVKQLNQTHNYPDKFFMDFLNRDDIGEQQNRGGEHVYTASKFAFSIRSRRHKANVVCGHWLLLLKNREGAIFRCKSQNQSYSR